MICQADLESTKLNQHTWIHHQDPRYHQIPSQQAQPGIMLAVFWCRDREILYETCFFLEDEEGVDDDDDDDDDDDEEEEEEDNEDEYCRAAQRQVLRLVRCSWTPCPGNTNTHPSSTAAKNMSSNLLNVPPIWGAQ